MNTRKLIKNITNIHSYSGVQRLLVARGQRASWMPSNFFKEVPSKILSIRLAKFLTTSFSHLPKFFTLSRKFAPWMAPRAASCPGNDIFLFFFGHLPTFFTKSRAMDAPLWPSHLSHPLCTPLHTHIHSLHT